MDTIGIDPSINLLKLKYFLEVGRFFIAMAKNREN
jgi:hypothetical protein